MSLRYHCHSGYTCQFAGICVGSDFLVLLNLPYSLLISDSHVCSMYWSSTLSKLFLLCFLVAQLPLQIFYLRFDDAEVDWYVFFWVSLASPSASWSAFSLPKVLQWEGTQQIMIIFFMLLSSTLIARSHSCASFQSLDLRALVRERLSVKIAYWISPLFDPFQSRSHRHTFPIIWRAQRTRRFSK